MRRLLLMLLPAAVLGICLYFVQLPLWVESPGGAREVLPLIAVDGRPTYDSDGRLLLTTVRLGRANLYYLLRAWADPTASILSEREVLPPGQTDREYERISTSQMDSSKIAGVAAGLQHVTEYPALHGRGAVVQDIARGGPADGRLFPGDLILEIEGEPLADLDALRASIEGSGGSPLRFTVRPVEGGERRTTSIRPVLDPDEGRYVIGIYPVANFPFEVTIDNRSIGGPSAGLMWSLGVADLLTPEDLTGDRVIAGTGTVDALGNVGPIGGVALKVVAAERADAETFLVPVANLDEARAARADLELVAVNTVTQAIEYLERTA